MKRCLDARHEQQKHQHQKNKSAIWPAKVATDLEDEGDGSESKTTEERCCDSAHRFDGPCLTDGSRKTPGQIDH
jgi:hypothetical protein